MYILLSIFDAIGTQAIIMAYTKQTFRYLLCLLCIVTVVFYNTHK